MRGRLPGVSDIRVSTLTETLTATLDEARTSREELEATVSALGYPMTCKEAASDARHAASLHDHESRDQRAEQRERPDHHDQGHDHHPGHPHRATKGGGPKDASASLSSHGHYHEETGDQRWWQTAKGRLVALTGALLAIAFLSQYVVPQLAHWLYIAATLMGVVPVARRGGGAGRGTLGGGALRESFWFRRR